MSWPPYAFRACIGTSYLWQLDSAPTHCFRYWRISRILWQKEEKEIQHIHAAKASCTQYHQSTNVFQLHKRKCVYVKYSYTFTIRYAKFAEDGVCSTISLWNSILLQSAYIIFTFIFTYVPPYCSTNRHCSPSNETTIFVFFIMLDWHVSNHLVHHQGLQ